MESLINNYIYLNRFITIERHSNSFLVFERVGADEALSWPPDGRSSGLLTGDYDVSFYPIPLALVPNDTISEKSQVTFFF